MLSSSSPPSKYPSSYSGGSDDDDQIHQHSAPTALAVPHARYADDGNRPPLSPITFERAPSPDLDPLELSGQEPPTPRLPPISSSHPHEDDVGVPTPIATTNHDMPFSTFIIPSSQHPNNPTHSNPHSRSVSRTGSSEMGGSRASSDTGHSRSGGIFSQKEKISPAQLALWEKDRERITRDMLEVYEGEACLIRFEPKQGWIGFWNRSNIEKVIEGLRELRSPKP